MRKRNIQHTTPANRSVFYDLGFDAAEARVLAMRADLMAALREHIKGRGWTQSKAAKELGITQPRVSALMKGAWRDFSADMLLVLASRVGLNPTLKLAARSERPDEELSSPKCKAQLPANRSPHAPCATSSSGAGRVRISKTRISDRIASWGNIDRPRWLTRLMKRSSPYITTDKIWGHDP